MRNLWAQVTAPPGAGIGPGSLGQLWTGDDYDAAKIEREEGWPAPPEPPSGPPARGYRLCAEAARAVPRDA